MLLVASACSKGTAAVKTTVNNPEKNRLSVVAIRALSSSIGPVVVGEIHNDSSGPVSGARVTVDLKDKQGSVIGEHFGFTLLHVIPAGQKAPVSIPYTGGSRAVGTVSATVSAEPTVPEPYVTLKVDGPQAMALGSNYEVSGTVVNSSEAPVNFTNVVATFYDKAGQVVGAAHDVSSEAEIPPGKSAPFLIVLVEQGPMVANYTLAAEAKVVHKSN